MSIVSTSDRATLMNKRKLILILDLDHTLLNSTKLNELSLAEQSKGFTRYTIGDLFWLDLDDLLLTKLYLFAWLTKVDERHVRDARASWGLGSTLGRPWDGWTRTTSTLVVRLCQGPRRPSHGGDP